MERLSERQIKEEYETEGVVFPLPILSPDATEKLLGHVQEFRASHNAHHTKNPEAWSYYPWEPQEYPLLEPLQELVRSPTVIEAVAPVLGNAFFIRNCDIFYKESHQRTEKGEVIPDAKEQVVWHVDEPHSPHADQMLTLWIV